MSGVELVVIVPTRGRPERIPGIVAAWNDTGAFDDGARLLFAWDVDDPKVDGYRQQGQSLATATLWGNVGWHSTPTHRPMVHKLNAVAALRARLGLGRPFALGFAGDDHLPQTRGWAGAYIESLRKMGTGVVYCNDGYQGENLATQWAMTTDIVETLGRMVPAPVEHLYCDNAVMDLARAVGRLEYLPNHRIEHQHPAAGHPGDEQHERVNSGAQYKTDRRAYRTWRDFGGLSTDAASIGALIKSREQQA